MQPVGIGTSLALIAVGAILRWAVTAHVSGVDLKTIGLILLLVGILGLVLTILFTSILLDRRRTAEPPAVRERDYYQ